MKLNIIHNNGSSDVILDAQTVDYILKRMKEKTEVKQVLINNFNIDETTINIFLESINPILCEKAKYNIFIPNQHKFHKHWIPLLTNIDLVLCKTHYCYDVLKDIIPTSKLVYSGWKSYDFYHSSIDKEYDEWLLIYNDDVHVQVQPVIDIWQSDWPTLNIVFSGVNKKRIYFELRFKGKAIDPKKEVEIL